MLKTKLELSIYFADNLRIIRKEFGLTQKQVADYCEVKKQAVNRWENKKQYPHYMQILKLCMLFECSSEIFFMDRKIIPEKDIQKLIKVY